MATYLLRLGGKNSDAKITEHSLKNNSEDIRNWFKERDVLIVDKGLRDIAVIHVIHVMNECDIKTAMSHLLKNSEKQKQMNPDLSPK